MDQQGFAWPLVLVMMAVITLIVVPTVSWTSTSLLGARQEQARVVDRYSADAGAEHAAYRVQYESGFVGSLTPSTTYTQTYNSRSTSVTVAAIPTPTPQPNPCVEMPGGNLCVSVSISPSYVTPNVFTTFTYNLSIWNNGTSTVHLYEIGDVLPAGFTYVAGSATSIGIVKSGAPPDLSSPTVTMVDGRQQVEWVFGSPRPDINAGVTGVLTFQATATPAMGTYSDTAWAEADPTSIGDVYAQGASASIVADWPKFDITSTAGGATIKARMEKRTKPAVTSYQVQ